jgi:hypothetical protein
MDKSEKESIKKRRKHMKDEIQIAWSIWNLISRLNDLLWDRYEDQFVQQYLNENELLYRGSLTDHMDIDDTWP